MGNFGKNGNFSLSRSFGEFWQTVQKEQIWPKMKF